MNNYRIPEIVKQYVEYDMIQSHTDLPDFPEYRTRLLYAFLNKDAGQEKNSELFALVTSLVQLALDTHDLVPVTNDNKEKAAARSRQLKVLAGDYFSSRFYNLLSQAGRIDVIKQLSTAICEVNRLKMSFYMLVKQWKVTTEDYLQHSVLIKMQLFLSFQKMMQELHAAWPEVLQAFTRCEVLAQELIRSESPQHFRGSWAYWHIMQWGTKDERKQLQTGEADPSKLKQLFLKYGVAAQLSTMLESQLQLFKNTIRSLDSDKLHQELNSLGEAFAALLSRPILMEER